MKNSTQKTYQEKSNQIVDYIHAHLHEPLPVDKIASAVCLSVRQLQRIVEAELRMTLSEYIVVQRLEQSVLYMQFGGDTLEEVAAKVGYDNPQSFSKAFKKHFRIAPRTYLNKLQERINRFLTTSHCNQPDLSSEIVDFEGLDLVYIRIKGKYGEASIYEQSWDNLIEFITENKVATPQTRYIGLSFDNPNTTVAEHCFFYACASVDKAIRLNGAFGTIRLPAGRYAVYTWKGSYSDLQPFYNQIVTNFTHRIRYGMPFEEYIGYSKEKPNEGLTKIYIPIK